MRADDVQIYLRPHLPTHKVEQDDNAFVVGCTFKTSDVIGERTGHNLYFGPFFERHLAARQNQPIVVFFVLKASTIPGGTGTRSTLVANQDAPHQLSN